MACLLFKIVAEKRGSEKIPQSENAANAENVDTETRKLTDWRAGEVQNPLGSHGSRSSATLRFANQVWGGAFGERSRGNTMRSNRTESLHEEHLSLRVSESASKNLERYTDNEDKVTQEDLSEVFGDLLGGKFSSRRLSVLLPLIVLPFDVSPKAERVGAGGVGPGETAL